MHEAARDDHASCQTAETLRAIIQQMPVACLIKDTNLRYKIVNDKYCKLIQLSRDDVIGRTSGELFSKDTASEYEARERRVLETGIEQELSQTITTAEGEERQYITRVTRIEGARSEKFVCITLFNVTELTAARQQAESADRMKSEFLATMSHELRTPLNGVLGLAQILKLENLSDDQARLVDLIVSSGQTLISVISDILDLTTIEAGHIKLTPTPFSVEELVEDITGLMTPIAETAGLTLFISCGPNPPIYAVGDAGRVKQILSNFVNNAIKFTDAGHVEVRFCGDTDLNELRLSVVDTGIGLNPDEQDAIFERFRQVEKPISRPRQGVGLGLSICQSLADLMDGKISVESVAGKGTSFTLTLPLNAAQSAASGWSVYPRVPVEVVDAHGPRARGWTSRLLAMNYPVLGSHDPGERVRIISFENADLNDDNLDQIEAKIIAGAADVAPAVITLPQNRTDARSRLAAAAVDKNIAVLSRPVSGSELRARLTKLSPAVLHPTGAAKKATG